MHVPGVTNRKHIMALSVTLYGSQYSKIGLVVLGLGIVFHIIGFSVPDWQKIDTEIGITKAGLWRLCNVEGCASLPGQSEWFLAVQILESLSLGIEILAVIVLVCYLYRGTRIVAYLAAILCISAGVTIIVGTVIFWADHDKNADLYWGFAFEVIGALNCLAAGGLFVHEGKTRTGYGSLR